MTFKAGTVFKESGFGLGLWACFKAPRVLNATFLFWYINIGW